MSDRSEYTNERLLIGRLKRLKRTLDEMKALQYMSNLSGITYYETTSQLPHDAMVVLSHVPGSYGVSAEFRVVFTADHQRWPFAMSMPRLFVGDTPNIANAQEVQRTDIDTGDPHMTMLDTPHKLEFRHGMIIDNPAPGRTKYVFIKNTIIGTDKGSFVTEGIRE